MKRLLILSMVCALLVGLNTGAAFAHNTSNTYDQFEVTNIQPEQLEQWLQQLYKHFMNQAPRTGETSDREQSDPVKITPVTPVETEPQQPADSVQKKPADSVRNLTAEEQQMVDLVNQERQKRGVAPLKVNNELVKVARLKAKDMIENNYFDHQSPTYGSPFEMMNQFGISYRTAGENLAGDQSVKSAHKGLMNSRGHRANILNGQFTEVGIGIVDGGPYGKMFVQLFKG